MPFWWGIAAQVFSRLLRLPVAVLSFLPPFTIPSSCEIKKPLSSHFLDLFSQQPGSLLNDVHDDIRVSMPSVRLHIATKRPVGCWELDGTEELFQETLISLLIVLVHNLNQSVSYLVCSSQASNNLSGFPFDFIITLLL